VGGILEVLLFASCFWMAVAVSPSASPSSLVSRSQSPGVCPAALLSCTLRRPKWQDVQWEMARIRLTPCQGHTYHAYSFVIYGEMKWIRKAIIKDACKGIRDHPCNQRHPYASRCPRRCLGRPYILCRANASCAIPRLHCSKCKPLYQQQPQCRYFDWHWPPRPRETIGGHGNQLFGCVCGKSRLMIGEHLPVLSTVDST
jgi:hypothetical protein